MTNIYISYHWSRIRCLKTDHPCLLTEPTAVKNYLTFSYLHKYEYSHLTNTATNTHLYTGCNDTAYR